MGDEKTRIFVVEDEALVAMLLEDMLADLGHEVVATAGRIEHAEVIALDTPMDLAIIDVNLNGRQTYPIARILSDRGIPFIFATGYGRAGLKPEWESAVTLQKPFQQNDLAAAISQAMKTNGQAAG